MYEIFNALKYTSGDTLIDRGKATMESILYMDLESQSKQCIYNTYYTYQTCVTCFSDLYSMWTLGTTGKYHQTTNAGIAGNFKMHSLTFLAMQIREGSLHRHNIHAHNYSHH